MTSRFLLRLGFGVMLCSVTEFGAAADRVSVDGGMGNHVDILGINVGSGDWKRWPLAEDLSIALYGKGGVALWVGRDQNTQNKYVYDVSAYPVLRLEANKVSQKSLFLEAGIGANLLSHTRINNSRQFSTAFQFGEFLGAGVTFGETRRYELGIRVQHVSNGNIKFPNDGLTYGSVVFQYTFVDPD